MFSEWTVFFCAQTACFVHKHVVFVHFVWLCAQKNVPLHRFSEKNTHYLINNYGFKDCCVGQASARHP